MLQTLRYMMQAHVFSRIFTRELAWQAGEAQLAPVKAVLGIAGAIGSAWVAPKIPGTLLRAMQNPDWRSNFVVRSA